MAEGDLAVLVEGDDLGFAGAEVEGHGGFRVLAGVGLAVGAGLVPNDDVDGAVVVVLHRVGVLVSVWAGGHDDVATVWNTDVANVLVDIAVCDGAGDAAESLADVVTDRGDGVGNGVVGSSSRVGVVVWLGGRGGLGGRSWRGRRVVLVAEDGVPVYVLVQRGVVEVDGLLPAIVVSIALMMDDDDYDATYLAC